MEEKEVKIGNRKMTRKYIELGVTAFAVILASIVCFFVFFKIRSIMAFVGTSFKVLEPIVFGVVTAYVLNPVEKFFEKKILKYMAESSYKKTGRSLDGKKRKRSKQIAVIVTVSIFVGFIYILFNMMIPELYKSAVKLVEEFPNQFEKTINGVSGYIITHTDKEFVENAVDRAYSFMDGWVGTQLPEHLNGIITYIANGVRGVLGTILNLAVGVIISVYVLNSKEMFSAQSKKVIYAFFGNKTANSIIEGARKSNEIFSSFITGKILGTITIGIICFVFMMFMGMPYSMLISVVIGITNIIPFFGPIIGSVISAFLILLEDPVKFIYFVLFIMVLQTIDANIIEPKLLGQSTGLSAFWVVVAVLMAGSLFGFAGLIMGVPVFAVIYHFVKQFIEKRLIKKNLPSKTKDFIKLDKVSKTGDLKYFDDNSDKTKKYPPKVY